MVWSGWALFGVTAVLSVDWSLRVYWLLRGRQGGLCSAHCTVENTESQETRLAPKSQENLNPPLQPRTEWKEAVLAP